LLPRLKAKYPIEKLGIFGSVARGESTAQSDLDLIVLFNGPIGWEFVNLAEELEIHFQCKVDLVSQKGIKSRYWEHIQKEVVYA
jgi:predicted nucleotidyltransferase